MTNFFWLDGACCSDYGIKLQGPVEFDSPTPKISIVTVPGRNGDLHFYEGAFNNVSGRVNCFALQHGVAQRLPQITKWLLLKQGYRRLETSDEPNIYRLARISNGPETAIRLKTLAPFSIEFDCKPQRFLKSGEYPLKLDVSKTLYNTGFPALPLIRVNGIGAGNLYVGKYTVQILELDEYLILDSNAQNAYKDTLNKNGTISTTDFPVLEPEENSISWDGGISSIEITPRWWTL